MNLYLFFLVSVLGVLSTHAVPREATLGLLQNVVGKKGLLNNVVDTARTSHAKLKPCASCHFNSHSLQYSLKLLDKSVTRSSTRSSYALQYSLKLLA
ncbi:jg19151 [Pararge aegeria aegeria]|uniref:Jg19151 protein n=1 Tax=Pararge aegeria aegeria TaxID=348720 RepID=A0A8S4QMX8_9NEOP|nr:jg19151 [Pararge aegeria aegeria]